MVKLDATTLEKVDPFHPRNDRPRDRWRMNNLLKRRGFEGADCSGQLGLRAVIPELGRTAGGRRSRR